MPSSSIRMPPSKTLSTTPTASLTMISDMFHVRDGSHEIYKAIPMPVLTLKFADESKNISFGVIDPAGLIFVTDNIEALKKMHDPEFFDMQIRQLQIPDDS